MHQSPVSKDDSVKASIPLVTFTHIVRQIMDQPHTRKAFVPYKKVRMMRNGVISSALPAFVDHHFSKDGLKLLRDLFESHLVNVIKVASLSMSSRQQKTLTLKDIDFAHYMSA